MEKITEEMHLEKEWFKEANQQTIETLPDFLNHLTEDYYHDYGTICHAITAAALAAVNAVDKTSQGGITGFQASCIMWDFIRQWMYPNNTCGLKLVDYDNMLFPQYSDHFEKTISPEAWNKVQARAKELLAETADAHPVVRAHWQSIVDGQVPFGYVVKD